MVYPTDNPQHRNNAFVISEDSPSNPCIILLRSHRTYLIREAKKCKYNQTPPPRSYRVYAATSIALCSKYIWCTSERVSLLRSQSDSRNCLQARAFEASQLDFTGLSMCFIFPFYNFNTSDGPTVGRADDRSGGRTRGRMDDLSGGRTDG